MTAEQEREERRKMVLKKLRKTRPGETVCLAGWEVELLMEYINALKGAAKHGTSEV